MSSIFDEFNSIEWRTWETLYAIDRIHAHWSENEALISRAAEVEELINKPNWKPETQEEYAEFREEVRVARHLHDEIMLPNFRYSILVMIYSTFERELLRLKENVVKSHSKAPISSKELRGGPTEQAIRFLQAFYAIDLKANNHYQEIKNLQKVRDCIVHCLGEAELSKDKDYLLKFSESRNDISIELSCPIEIENGFILYALRTVWNFYILAFDACGWNVNDSWNKLAWPSTS